MEKKSCRCRLFSCFACCFSDDNTTLPPAQRPDPSVTSTVATDDALHHRPQPIVPSAASTSSEATTSTDVPQPIVHPDASASSKTTTSTDVPQPIVPPAASTSSEATTSPVAFPARDKVYQVASTSSNAAASSHNVAGTSSSSSVSKASHLIDNIVAAASAVDTDADLDDLIGYISTLLEPIKAKKTETKSSKTERAKDYWQSRSGSLRKIREILSDGINVFKDIFPGEATTAIQGLFKGMGTAHLACTGLLVVALVLERFDTVSTNEEECLCVLDAICKLGKHVNDIKQRSRLRKDMGASIREATDLIMEASIMCSTQIGSSKGRRLLSASKDKVELVKFQQELQRVYRHIDSKMGICLYDAVECRQVRPQKLRERPYPDYAVGIEKPLEEVKKLLDWESDKNAVAVVLHGFGGMGKTTLADAVFARLCIEECKYSMVRLFDDVTSEPSTSDILKLQRYILKDLNMGTHEKTPAEIGTPEEETPADIRTPEEGQREIGRILQKEKAFIYVDNVLQRYPFEQLLPRDMDKAKKLRLLITTRDTDVSRAFNKLKPEIYSMKGLPHTEAKSLLEKEMYTSYTDNTEKQLSDSQLEEIVEMCGYIPKLLTVVAGFISCAEDEQKAYRRLKEEREKNWKGEIGDDISHYVFAYQTLDERVKDPFLDICSFFNGQEWSTVADIVGDSELNSLEKRALVTKKRTEAAWTEFYEEKTIETVWVHDVILAMGHQQTEGTRFSSAKKIQEFLDEKEDKDIQKIKGIMLWKVDETLSISASKLDLMCSSLRVFQLRRWSKVEGKCTKIFEKLIYVAVDIPNFPIDVSRSKELKYLRWEGEGDLNEELLGPSISKLQCLRVLNLHSCNNLPKEMGPLNSLQKLHLSKCDRLKALPSSLGKLSLLRSLVLWKCESLKHLPKDIGSLNSLQTLHLYLCTSLEALPSSLGKLSLLRSLVLSECESLKHLPKDIGSLNSLQTLHLYECKSLEEIPSSIENLSSLQELRLSSCDRLKALPSSLGKLSSLRFLYLSYCGSLKDLPCDLGKLTSLTELSLRGCKELISIPSSLCDLSLLRILNLSECGSLKDLPCDLGKLTSLTKLSLEVCKELISIPSSLGKLSSLRVLSLYGCRSLKDLPCDLGKLTSLANLDIVGCKELSSIPESIGQLKSLESSIRLSRTGLKELPDGFCNLSFITNLEMENCERLEKLPDRFGEVASLRKLSLANCKHLEKLPESFGQLKYLEHLDLSGCTILEELCIHFNGFSSLRFLKLDCCKMLKKLPEDFHCLTSLEVLSVRDCHMLDGKCMENLVEMKTLQTVNIRGSPMLEERWEEIERQGDHSWSFAVYRGQGSSNEESKQHILKQLHSKIDSILTNGRVSDLPLNTLLLVLFDGHDEFHYDFPSSLIEENIDDIPTNFEMIYFGNHFNKLPQKMADRILGHAPANSNAQVLFQKVLAAFGADPNWTETPRRRCKVSAKIVNDRKNDKYLSCWELLTRESMEKVVINKCGRYLKLKELVEKGGESNRELLRELFASGEEEGTLSFLKNDASQEMRVEELEGKTILLDIRPARMYDDDAEMQSDNLLQSLKEMYVAEKERLDFEIITIPIMQKYGGYVFQQFSRQVPWLLLQNPGRLKSVIKFFLLEDCAAFLKGNKMAWDRWYPGTMRVIERNGTIAGHNPAVLRMVNTWGAKAYPFTEEKRVELEEEEGKQMKGMSNLEFLFQNMESLWEQVKEIMFKGKMICLYSTSEAGFAGSITNALIELGDNIHIIYIPLFKSAKVLPRVYFTEGIWTRQFSLKNIKMPQIEMQGMPVLNLCEQEAMRFWARIYSLKECINGMDDNDKQLDGIKKLLYFIDQGYSLLDIKYFNQGKQYSWMGIMDEDGELVTTLGKETIDNPKELIEALIKCTKDCKRETLVELE